MSDPDTEAIAEARALQEALQALAEPQRVPQLERYFKCGPGEYGEGDRFRGVRVPAVRAVLKHSPSMSLSACKHLLQSQWHEDRLLALLAMVRSMERKRTPPETKAATYATYMAHTQCINNWDLVDASAKGVVGRWLFRRDRAPLDTLIQSPVLWERRIGIMATFFFIIRGETGPTFAMAERLLADQEDLMHKATGWMLREAGKKQPGRLEEFLTQNAPKMPRTTLRYAIERLPEERRKYWLQHRA